MAGLNEANCRLLNKSSGAIDALIDLCREQGAEDWRLVSSTALALGTSSSNEVNRTQLAQDAHIMVFLIELLGHADPEVQVRLIR